MTQHADSPKAPAHLSDSTASWWETVATDYVLEEHHLRLLTLAAEALDRGEEARRTIEVAGAFYDDRFGQPRAHPAVAVERDARASFKSLLRELDLDTEPNVTGNRRKK